MNIKGSLFLFKIEQLFDGEGDRLLSPSSLFPCLSDPLSVSLSPCIRQQNRILSPCVSLSLSLCVSLSPDGEREFCLPLSVFLCLSVSPCLSVSLSASLSASLSVSLCLCARGLLCICSWWL